MDETIDLKKPSAVFFNAGRNEQVFSPKPWINLAQIRFLRQTQTT